MTVQHVITHQLKSVPLGIVLALFFGPFGLMYASPMSALIGVLLWIPIVSLGFTGIVIFHIITIILGAAAVLSHNRQIEKKCSKSSG